MSYSCSDVCEEIEIALTSSGVELGASFSSLEELSAAACNAIHRTRALSNALTDLSVMLEDYVLSRGKRTVDEKQLRSALMDAKRALTI